MIKYHRNKNTGLSAICNATVKPCPNGGANSHSYSKEEMDKYCDKYNEALYSMSIKKLEEYARENKEENDLYRTVLYERLNKDKKKEKRNYKDLRFSEFVEHNSGISLSIKNNEIENSGFFVSPYPEHSLAISGNLTDEQFRNVLENYVKNKEDILSKNDHVLGLWRSPYDNNLYIDISVRKEDASIARDIGEGRDQQAYFDMQTFEEITINAFALSGQAA